VDQILLLSVILGLYFFLASHISLFANWSRVVLSGSAVCLCVRTRALALSLFPHLVFFLGFFFCFFLVVFFVMSRILDVM